MRLTVNTCAWLPQGVNQVLTSYQTFSTRHGPADLFAERRRRVGERQAQALFDVPDRNWTYSLEDCFAGVVLDEGHLAKNPRSHINVAVRWLNAPFVVLAMATPLHSGIGDYLLHG